MSKKKMDQRIIVPVIIPPLTVELEARLCSDSRLDKLYHLITSQALIIGQGAQDDSVLWEIGNLFAERYSDINTTVLPGVCNPLFDTINKLLDEYGEEISRRIVLERSAQITEAFTSGLIMLAKNLRERK